jgi:acetyl esterase
MPSIHADAEALQRELLAADVRPVRELSVSEARAAEDAEAAADGPFVTQVVDVDLPSPAGDVPVRLYLPDGERALPVLLFFSGGGWVLGSLDAADPICRRLANAASCAVVSVDYRRAPEHPFPAGLEDCYAATLWIAHGGPHNLDSTRVAVGGLSAGGNLAAAVALLARERGGPRLALQLLVYPPLDHEARHDDRGDPFFGPGDVAWCWSHYLADPSDGENPLASPLRAEDLRCLPPALVITAELDPLRDEGELYVERLRDAGVPVELVRVDGVTHGFFSRSDRLAAAREAQERAACALRWAFEPGSKRSIESA